MTAGSFHPTAPTRILDTRTGLGIASPVRSGDGRHPSPDPITRRDETANHDLQVTGRFGIPASGVSAVLLNVTAVSAGAPGPGFMSVVPKPARVGDVFNDQGTYGAFPATSNLNIDNGDPDTEPRAGESGRRRQDPHRELPRPDPRDRRRCRMVRYRWRLHRRFRVRRRRAGPTVRQPPRHRWPSGTVRRRRDPQPAGRRCCRRSEQRPERRAEHHDGRLERTRLPDGVPSGQGASLLHRTSTSPPGACERTPPWSRSAPEGGSTCSSRRRTPT